MSTATQTTIEDDRDLGTPDDFLAGHPYWGPPLTDGPMAEVAPDGSFEYTYEIFDCADWLATPNAAGVLLSRVDALLISANRHGPLTDVRFRTAFPDSGVLLAVSGKTVR